MTSMQRRPIACDPSPSPQGSSEPSELVRHSPDVLVPDLRSLSMEELFG